MMTKGEQMMTKCQGQCQQGQQGLVAVQCAAAGWLGATLDTNEWTVIKIYLNGQYCDKRGSQCWGTVMRQVASFKTH